MAALGHDFGDKLCEVLGIDAAEKHVYGITLEATVDAPVSVTLKRYLLDEEAEEITRLLERYNLVPEDDNA